ncbi:MAG: tRNA uridine-5-carboxymethylaminomethyl(34) synthesis GTPase MnmE, partial [Spirochaetes bacterium]|nr:tRNA uridine-5-carboxymethylaminomethyl(34) synthesis GTPase MnmE [Spirochaetota bacterium]
GGQPPVAISAKTGEGLSQLCAAIAAAAAGLQGEDSPAAASLGSARQKELVENALLFVQDALQLAGEEAPLDLIAPLLREAVNSLGKITGEVSSDDILEEMFSRFCVGK